ncbi:PIG-L deacetylase family protein [Deinococcus yavapaiensis]|uniref:LmbE family N-acetylglucosaminyl deacetylase n=1 Tax=Deinococcus yavapaiensis KR-236 TaxID=694435 RepID=A0A318S8V8_9DEIO|nr:PIG-L family deacetylase [Deinococcus yavapaiensis]PYE54555.1 LmbE family N-acetylglucosaminyl deacetylase [Deinococcus yavapaiensis KR-236]
MTRRQFIVVLTAFVVLFAAFAINASPALRLLYPRAAATIVGLQEVEVFKARQRVLVVSPHPDDESLCCAGAIQQAQDAGATVFIVWMTNGDGFEFDAILLNRTRRPRVADLQNLGRRRMVEARGAAEVLGVPQSRLYFLGYPDGGTLHMFLENYATPYRSRYTGAARVPYGGTLSPGAAYTGANVERDFETVLNRVKPDIVLAPSPQDQHPDHRAASYFVTRALARRGATNKLRFWIIHGGLEWPLPKGYHPALPLTIPPRGVNLSWQRRSLTEAQEAVKLRAIRTHATQMLILGRFMEAFVRQNELQTRSVLPPLPDRR